MQILSAILGAFPPMFHYRLNIEGTYGLYNIENG